jgi:hypothetical protein
MAESNVAFQAGLAPLRRLTGAVEESSVSPLDDSIQDLSDRIAPSWLRGKATYAPRF